MFQLKKEFKNFNYVIEYKKEMVPEKFERKSIPITVKNNLWKLYFGENFNERCNVCKNDINVHNFEAGHITSVKNGGSDNIENLVPICSTCNKSMGIQNLNDFKKNYY